MNQREWNDRRDLLAYLHQQGDGFHRFKDITYEVSGDQWRPFDQVRPTEWRKLPPVPIPIKPMTPYPTGAMP